MRRVTAWQWLSVRVNDVEQRRGTLTVAYMGYVRARAAFYGTWFKTASLPVSCFIVLRRDRWRHGESAATDWWELSSEGVLKRHRASLHPAERIAHCPGFCSQGPVEFKEKYLITVSVWVQNPVTCSSTIISPFLWVSVALWLQGYAFWFWFGLETPGSI